MNNSEIITDLTTCGDFLSSRRTFLSGATLALGGFVLSSTDVEAATRKYDVDLNRLPYNWVRREGGNIFRYAKFIDRLDLKHIHNQQVIQVHARAKGSTWNSLPPSHYWDNIAHTLKAMDRISSSLKCDVEEIVSLYRSPAYNARCRGASRNSYHKKNVAMDVVMPCSSWTTYSRIKYYRDKKRLFKGGVGRYNSFTHIDTRGYNATW